MADVKPESVQFSEAIDFLRGKTNVPTRAWTDIWQSMHSVAFVVAGATTEALVEDFHQAVNQAIEQGTTLADFRKDFDRIVSDHGWQYKGKAGWRSRVIFETNLRMAYSAGRWAQIQRLKHVRPYLRYVTVEDERVRPEHRHWHNVCLPVDDPWWQTHFPPNGWGCRCRVVSLSVRDLKRYGVRVWDKAPEIKYVAKQVKTPAGPVTISVPEGIDPGFAYNPGAGAFGSGTNLLGLEKHGPWEALTAPGQDQGGELPMLPRDPVVSPLLSPVKPGDADALRAALIAALGEAEIVVTDPTGAAVRLGMAIVDHILESPSRQDGRERYFPLMPELIRDPAEIWIGWASDKTTGKVAMRRRYVKIFDLGAGTTIGLVADADGHEWSGITFFRGNRAGAKRLRTGLLIYQRDKKTEEKS